MKEILGGVSEWTRAGGNYGAADGMHIPNGKFCKVRDAQGQLVATLNACFSGNSLTTCAAQATAPDTAKCE